ncbi:glycosyltransferase family 4 protein [Methylobacillus caricis]|uniref:glycosyltransferase family 4 protein n=1 Tax=Methylobacillus caricis TaxID=1971611 RepID=UPI001CFF7465|nr:glycosyltransferase family 4 protein [Methylobacillus caricis]MCB5188079.1 glycosyltransferase family 4 protein [Methylobacillus caricis]
MRRVLLSAFACDPVFGSDEEVGWQWARELSNRQFDVTVLTRKTHQKEIERHISETGECNKVRFEYIDIEWLYPLLSKINKRNHIYYYFWQYWAYRRACQLQAKKAFDCVHHVTWVSFRQPSFMGGLNIPMIFGPVAGGDEVPAGYTQYFSLKQRLVERVRRLVNGLVRFDPLMRMTYRAADKVFFTSAHHLKSVPAFVIPKARVELAIGSSGTDIAAPSTVRKQQAGPRLLYAGRCLGWKGMDLGLRVFAEIYQARPDVTLTIIGDGVDRKRWEKTAHELGVGHAVNWMGWLSKADVIKMYSEYDILFYPSLRDSGGFVVLEALQQGLPVACLKLGGPGVVVDESCGVAVEAAYDIGKTIIDYRDSVLTLMDRISQEHNLSQQCQRRVRNFTWSALIERIYGSEY